MPKQRSIAQARANLPELIREAEAGDVIELTRRGQSVAVLIGRQQYERLATGSRRFSEAWDEFTREIHLEGLELDPDAIFSDVRDTAPGREPGL